MQNLYQLVNCSFISSQNRIHVMSHVTLHVNMTLLTVEERLLIKTLQTDKGWIVEKNDCRVSSETVEITHAV